MSRTLVAKWFKHTDPSEAPPSEIQWGDGRTATLADYVRHLGDTHRLSESRGVTVMTIYPDLVADVVYDTAKGRWICRVNGDLVFTFEANDPDATDDQLITEMYQFPTVYRANIHR